MLNPRIIYNELIEQKRHGLFPSSCYDALLNVYDEIIKISDELCQVLIRGTKTNSLKWKKLSLYEISDEALLQWTEYQLANQLDINIDANSSVYRMDGSKTRQIFVYVDNNYYLIQYPNSLILYPKHQEAASLLLEIEKSISVDFEENLNLEKTKEMILGSSNENIKTSLVIREVSYGTQIDQAIEEYKKYCDAEIEDGFYNFIQ